MPKGVALAVGTGVAGGAGASSGGPRGAAAGGGDDGAEILTLVRRDKALLSQKNELLTLEVSRLKQSLESLTRQHALVADLYDTTITDHLLAVASANAYP